MLKEFKPRLYQQTILATAVNNNTLVVLPTGLGKTAIALLLSAQRLQKYPDSKILMLAPTKPLCEQHQFTFQENFDINPEKIVLFTGSVKPDVREQLWKESTIIISTPQGLENDLINKRISFDNVSALIFDEGHHATGDYSYVWLAERYEKDSTNSRILALTASPGTDIEKIQEVCANLKIEKVEVRSEKDGDVKPYVQKTKVEWIELQFPERFKKLHQELKSVKNKKLEQIKALGFLTTTELNKTQLLKLQRLLQRTISKEDANFDVYKSLSLLAEALKIEHALELIECQGLRALQSYLQKLIDESKSTKIKAVKNLVIDPNFKAAKYWADNLIEAGENFPKIIKLSELLNQTLGRDNNAKIIVFSNYRDSASEISNSLNELKINNKVFVGQSKKNGVGLTQKKQKEMLDEFRKGEFNVLVATSVAEEGLDIPKVDQVIFYEPTTSAIRNIQRRGRTGRLEEGNVKVMYIKGTRDEAYRWASYHKEKNMHKILDKLRSDVRYLINDKDSQNFSSAKGKIISKDSKVTGQIKKNKSLSEFAAKKQEMVAILADYREKDNKIVKELINLDVSVRSAQLTSADYVVSGQVGVELKKVPDFVDSLLDGRLLSQLKDLKNNFPKCLLIVEGEVDIYSQRKVHPNAIRGALATIALSFNVPILYTKNPKDTAQLLAVMARREQQGEVKDFSLHISKPLTIKEQQEYVISALPGLGMGSAKNLLEHFGSVKEIANAHENDFLKVKGVGKITAKKLVEVFSQKYQ